MGVSLARRLPVPGAPRIVQAACPFKAGKRDVLEREGVVNEVPLFFDLSNRNKVRVAFDDDGSEPMCRTWGHVSRKISLEIAPAPAPTTVAATAAARRPFEGNDARCLWAAPRLHAAPAIRVSR